MMESGEIDIQRCFNNILKIIGIDKKEREKTSRRVAKMFYRELFSTSTGVLKFPSIMTEDIVETDSDSMVLSINIRAQSICAHHLLPMFGVAHIAYIPQGKVIGLSKLNRIVDFYGRKPQLQEKFTQEIAQSIQKVLDIKDIAVTLDLRHLCIEMRGIRHHGGTTRTSILEGEFFEDASLRQEYFSSLGRVAK